MKIIQSSTGIVSSNGLIFMSDPENLIFPEDVTRRRAPPVMQMKMIISSSKLPRMQGISEPQRCIVSRERPRVNPSSRINE